ncbi:MAG: HEAT repeat domain-containing protein [bacterium]
MISRFFLVFFLASNMYALTAEEFREKLSSPRDLQRRQAVYEIIHSTLPEATAVELLGSAVRDKDIFTRRMVISGLGKFEDEEAVEVLESVLEDETAIIRSDAVRALANFPAETVKENIVWMLGDKNFIVVKEALNAVAKLKITDAEEEVMKFLKSRNEIVRTAAVDCASAMALGEAYKTIRQIAEDGQSVSCRKNALNALVEIKPEEQQKVLKEFLKDDNLEVALEAAFILAKKFDPSGKKIVSEAVKNDEPQIRIDAAKILLYYDDEESRVLLKTLLNDRDKTVRDFVKNNMGEER